MSTEFYLGNTTYIKLMNNPNIQFKSELKDLLEEALTNNIVDTNIYKFIFQEHPRIPTFYFLPKVHKSKTNPPGRPIISGIDSLTCKLSQFIDHSLQKYAQAAKSYLKDTKHLLQELDSIEWQKDYIWITLDVNSLYSVIDHNQGLEAVRKQLEGDGTLDSTFRSFLLKAIRFILTHNFFMFNDEFFLQIKAFYSEGQQCRLPITEISGMSQPGDIVIGVLLPLHLDKVYQQVFFKEEPPKTKCTSFYSENLQQLQAMRFAVSEINRNKDILPNVTLGFQAYDSCDVLQNDLKGALAVITGHDKAIPNYRCIRNISLTSIIGPSISTHSILLAHVLGLYNYPLISHFATSPLLSNRKKFPSFFRTVPSDIFQSKGLAHLVLHLGWTWIGLLAVDNDYGQQGIQLVQQEIVDARACIAFTENILTSRPDRNAPHIVKVMKASTAIVVIIFATSIDLVPILEEMMKQNITRRVLVASEAWSITTMTSLEKFSNLLSGTIGLAFSSGTIPGLKEFLNTIHPSMSLGREWIKIFWELAFNCKFMDDKNQTGYLDSPKKECTGSENIETVRNIYTDVTRLRTTYSVYIAVHVVANALEDLKRCRKEKGPYFQGLCADIRNFMPYQLLYYMKKVRFKLYSGREIYFDENGDPPAVYDIVNWQLSPAGAMRNIKVGSYDTAAPQGKVLTINTSAILWPSGYQEIPVSVCSQSCLPGFWKVTREGEPVCCFQCVPCPQGEISNQTDSFNCIKCPWDMWPNPVKTKCLPKPIEYLSYEDPLGTVLASISAISSLLPIAILKIFIKFKTTPIVKANNYSLSCILLVSLTFCFLCSLAFIGYPQPEKCLLRQATFGMVFSICISCILAKTLMVVFAFMATKPGSNLKKWTTPTVSYAMICICSVLQFCLCVAWLTLVPPFPEHNIETQPKCIILQCNEGSPTAFWCMLGYLGLLATVSFIVAFLARRLPDSFNEAKFITFSMLAFLSVWVSYIPASLSSTGKYTVAMEIFAILTSSWALLICMFVPKCFIILLRSNMNSREHLMKKAQGTPG
ncbi:extracellular calcium-sensing receptor-like [Pelobates fuscus]|uniref:extracellular calcium-sensing receptor-like n=1 Tax=Pelobates fuscus TaxID=191477 RepID=UPI002FE49983